MTITRRGLADEIDRLDGQLAEIQTDKAEIYKAYREQLEADGKTKPDIAAEVAVMKAAIRQRQALAKNRDAVIERDAKVEEALAEISQPAKNNARSGSGGAARGRSDETAPTRARASVEPAASEAAPAVAETDELDIPPALRRGHPDAWVQDTRAAI